MSRAPIASSQFSAPKSIFEPRRVLAAFALGAALAVAGLGAFSANIAAAHGPFGLMGSFVGYATENSGGSDFHRELLGDEPSSRGYRSYHAAARYDDQDTWPRHRRHRIEYVYPSTHVHGRISLYTATKAAYGARPVCVRLCDGAYFPLNVAAGDAASQASACNSQCPDAPTEVYYLNGSDKIEDGVSAKGQPYTALPVALRYRTTFDNTCTCHRDAVAYAPFGDATLKKGDAVMTPAGMMVFNGAEGGKHKAADFTALASAKMPADQRGALQAMEKVSLAKDHPTLGAWLAAQAAPRKPDAVAAVRPDIVSRGDDRIRLVTWRSATAQD